LSRCYTDVFTLSFPTRRSSDLSAAGLLLIRHTNEAPSLTVPAGVNPASCSACSPVPPLAGKSCAQRTTTPPPSSWWSTTTVTPRSEEHTSELQSRENLVCRLQL